MLEIPFWVQSPSPFTWAFWIVMALWGHLQLRGRIHFKRWQLICGIVQAAMVLGIVVFFYDSIWILGQWFRFGEVYPKDVDVLKVRLTQNVGFLAVCLLMSYPLIKQKILRWKWITSGILLVAMLYYFLAWFCLAPDPSWTDWTFAYRFDYPGSRILEAYLISHLAGKLLQGLLFISLWNRPPFISNGKESA